MVNWYMVVVGVSGKHVPKWEKKHGKLVHGSGGLFWQACTKNDMMLRKIGTW